MAQTGQSWSFFAGDICRIPIENILDSAGSPVDLTGREFRFALAPYSASGSILYAAPVLSVSSDDTPDPAAPETKAEIINAAGGNSEADPHVRMTFDPATTATLAVSKVTTYYLEAEVLEGDGSGKVTVLTGQVTFTPTIQNS